MSRLTALHLARWFRKRGVSEELPHLESLVEAEADKVIDGYHLARWIVPLAGVVVGLGVFLRLAMLVHPLFWIGAVGLSLGGLISGIVFHVLAIRISPLQREIRKRCRKLADRMVKLGCLMGQQPALAPEAAGILEEAACAYQRAGRPGSPNAASGVWDDAGRKARLAMEEAMAKMLTLADLESVQAQEAELAKGWAQPLLAEMQATADALVKAGLRAERHAHLVGESPIGGLAEARLNLERLDAAMQELQEDAAPDQLRHHS